MSNNSSNVIRITGDNGQEKDYLPISERYGKLLQAYPPKEGWSVQMDYRESEIPLTYGDGSPIQSVRITASLVKDGVVVAQGSTIRGIEMEGDYEAAETNARGRLLIALGLGSEQLLKDETEALAKRGRVSRKSKPAAAPQTESTDTGADAEPAAKSPAEVVSFKPTPASKQHGRGNLGTLIVAIETRARELGRDDIDTSMLVDTQEALELLAKLEAEDIPEPEANAEAPAEGEVSDATDEEGASA